MSAILPYILGFAMLATIGVLAIGVIGFAFGREGATKRSTQLMTARVILQGLAVALFGLLILMQVG
ncbi:MAG: HIG1 domain-containing protein [Hyphomicrobiales bacterium]|nr:HIG1 domain-containing protein [Hyphomicrobiales bacterium]